MSTDNVTPFPPGAQPPKPKKRQKLSLVGVVKFHDGEEDGSSTLHVYQGLRGVCNALDTVGDDINLHQDLSAAAAVLIGILEDRALF